jgi:pimeloyl-ACP methyl ester carboxylesterase
MRRDWRVEGTSNETQCTPVHLSSLPGRRAGEHVDVTESEGFAVRRESLIAVSQRELDDLRRRIVSTRWPHSWPTEPWAAGTDVEEMRRLADYWVDGYDWPAHEEQINALPSYTAEVEGQRIHFLRFDAEVPGAPAVVLTNGWPSTFFEMVELARQLSTPSVYGRAGLSFNVIVPSLPGFSFSDAPITSPPSVPTHELWHRLMTGLGFEQYFAHGGDLGNGITSRLAAAHPEAVLGIHVMSVGMPREWDEASLTEAERAHLARIEGWNRDEGAYMHQHRTRPLSLAFGLSDSPVGLLAWISEKYRAWSDRSPGQVLPFSDDFLLTQASLYWFTNTIGTSLRPYYEALPPHAFVTVPTALALFPADLQQPPRAWAERTHNVQRYTKMAAGGHFAATEQPAILTADIREFFTELLNEE